jgi:hypothetical protein
MSIKLVVNMYWNRLWLTHTWLRLYKTLDRPVLCYGSEAWTIRKLDINRAAAC